MNTSIKMLSLVLVLLIGLVGLTAIVSADSDLYEVTEVEVEGTTVYTETGGDIAQAEIGIDGSVSVEVEIFGTGDSTTCPSGDVDDCEVEVKVKAWIGGYEYDDVEDTTSTFDIEPGVTYRKTLTLVLPKDLDVEDDNTYTLYVEVYDDEDEERVDVDVYAERPRHSVNVYDVNFDSSVDAGDYLDVEVRLENLGEQKEENIKVKVELDGLGSDTEYLEELSSYEVANEDEEDSESVDLTIRVDDDAVSGYYDLIVTVTYDRGHEEVVEVYSVWVDGADVEETEEETEDQSEGGVTVSLSSTSLDGVAGEDTSFTLTFANLGSKSESFTVSVSGESQWASSDVDPSVVVVAPGETEKVKVTLSVDSDEAGEQEFTVQILDSKGELVQEVEIDVDVSEAEVSPLADTGSALKIAFIILIALIIIVGLIVAFRRLNDEDDDDPLEPKEGQTYY
jgi:uncharacterized membrane protein